MGRVVMIGAMAIAASTAVDLQNGRTGAPAPVTSTAPPVRAVPAPAATAPAAAAVARPTPAVTPAAQSPVPPGNSFNFATIERFARQRAGESYRDRSPALPEVLSELTFDQYKDIRFRRANALWRDQSLFEVQFFHRGFNFDRRVQISEVVDGVPRVIPYNPAWFEFGRDVHLPVKLRSRADLGYAGFRVHYPLHSPAYKDELIVFLGASYFRVLARNQAYGQSARALAIDTASASGEEIPAFTDFWLVRPAQAQQRSLTIYALLDSPSVVGAYQFEVRPGAITQVEIHSELFPRRSIAKLGIAPLTSMFFYGADPSAHRFDDFRPQVHDSDGLMAQTGNGEWLWRRLHNPRELRVNRFMDTTPRGFGLIQRDRDFAHYQDTDSQFERRPSYWVQPLGDWGRGGVELVEIPTDESIHDNIVAFWVPAGAVGAGHPLKFNYLLSAFSQSSQWPPGGRVIATRTDNAAIGGAKPRDDARRIIIDFAGGDLDGLDHSQPVQAHLTASGGRIDGVSVERLPETGVWRVIFRVIDLHAKQAADLHCYLTLYGEALTETWTDQLTLQSDKSI